MTPEELKSYVGSMSQIARVRTSVLDDGRGRGILIADVDEILRRGGAGFPTQSTISVSPDLP